MSEISFNDALEVFERLPARLRLASLHPSYVVADAARNTDLKPIFFAYRRGEHFWLHSGHLGLVPGSVACDIQSPYGYGGPLANVDNPDFVAEAWSAWCHWCRERGILAEFVRFHPMAENWTYFRGEVSEDRLTGVLDLAPGDITSRIEPRTRAAVRKARNGGLEAKWEHGDCAFAAFGKFYREAMSEIGANAFYQFTDKYFDGLARTGFARLMICRKQAVTVSAAIFLQSPSCLEYHLAASDDTGKRAGGPSLVLYAAAINGQDEKKTELYLGGGTDSSPDNPLFLFKRGFSSRRVPFRTGRYVHDPMEYDRLTSEWTVKFGKRPSRVLFYR